MRLGKRFLLLFLALSLGPLLAFFVLANENGRRAIEQSLGRLFELKAAQAVAALDGEVAALQGTVKAWAALEWMQDVLNDDVDGRLTTFLMQQVRSQPLLSGARVTNAAGTVIAASRPEWVGAPDQPPARVATGACHDEGQGGPDGALLTCRYPIRASFDDTRIIGGLEVSWNLPALFRQPYPYAGPATEPGDLVLLRRDGLVVFAPARWQGWVMVRNIVQDGSLAASRAAAGARGHVLERIQGEECLIGFAHSRGPSGWSALVLQDSTSAFAPVRRLRSIVFTSGTLLALVVAGLSVFVARRLTQPLLEIEKAARRVAAGDLSVQIVPRSSDELGSLAASFDRMVHDLREQHAQRVDKEYVDSLLASMVDGLLVIDAAGRVERVNPGLLALLGCEARDVIGRPAAELFAEGKDGLDAQVLEPARRSGAVREVELHLVERSGAQIPVSLSAGLLPAQGAAEPPIVCIAADERRRKSIERALQQAREAAEASSRAKDGFLATISHEVRTPLHGILGVVDLITGKRLGATPPEYAESLRRSAEALLAVVNQVLDFSKLDAGKVALERSEFVLGDLVDGVGEILASRAREKDLELVTRVEASLPARVIGDAGRLRQVLLNLGGNAIAFTRRGEVVIHASPGPPGTALVSFAVSDTGIGIPESDRSRLFQPFSQLDQTSTRASGGTGLGLAISRHLVRLMGGEIDLESEVGRGSTFRFAVPLEPVADTLSVADAGAFSLAGRRVLVVDDNATNRFVAREMLNGWGVSVTEASDGWDALERLRGREEGEPFDLALIDFQMPEMDGGQLAVEIRKDAVLASLPLVLLTSVPLHGEAVRMMKLGLDGCLTKPVRQAALRDTIAAVLLKRERAGGRPGGLTLVDTSLRRERRRVLVALSDEAASRHTRALFEQAGCVVGVARDAAEVLALCAAERHDLVVMAAALEDARSVLPQLREHQGESSRPRLVLVGSEEDKNASSLVEADDRVNEGLEQADVERILSRLPSSR
jgi:PAS domain S-box-containing protein